MAALHFLLPTGHSRSGRSSFDSKLISLLPLDEAPVHVHRFAARAPCDWKGSECQCGIHRAEAASALRSRKTDTHHLLIPASETRLGTHSVDMRLLPHVLEGVHHLVQSLVTARDLHLR